MSSEAMRWARAQKLGSLSLKALVNAMAARADKTGTTWASQRTLAADVGASDRHVRGRLAELELLGVITRTGRSAGRKGRLSDIISLALHRSFDLSAGDVRKARQRLTETRYIRNAPSGSAKKLQPEQNVVPTGTRVPGNIKGTTYPSQGEKTSTYQGMALSQHSPRLTVVGGMALKVEGDR